VCVEEEGSLISRKAPEQFEDIRLGGNSTVTPS
jgi:hypothetical protein